MIRLCAVWVSMLTLALLIGCGSSSGLPKTYKVTGSVTQNGTPVEGAIVTFLNSEKKDAVGSTNAKGEFKLSTLGPAIAANCLGLTKSRFLSWIVQQFHLPQPPPPGVIASGEISESYVPPSNSPGNTKESAPKNLLPAKYASEQTSGLVATVAENGPKISSISSCNVDSVQMHRRGSTTKANWVSHLASVYDGIAN